MLTVDKDSLKGFARSLKVRAAQRFLVSDLARRVRSSAGRTHFALCVRFAANVSQGKGSSIPGVKRGDNPWRPLTDKGQSISIGDRVCMQYKKNGPGGRVRHQTQPWRRRDCHTTRTPPLPRKSALTRRPLFLAGGDHQRVPLRPARPATGAARDALVSAREVA